MKLGRSAKILDNEEGGANRIDGGLDVGMNVREASRTTETES